jgi:single-strand DNA-binding protein
MCELADLNRTFLMGRLTQDPVLKRTGSGMAVCELQLATNRSWKGKDGEKREEVLYIGVQCWDRTAENVVQYLKKGSSIHVEGALQLQTWESKDGEKRSKIVVNAERVQFLDSKPRDNEAPREPAREDNRNRRADEPRRDEPAAKPAGRHTQDQDDGDIPF